MFRTETEQIIVRAGEGYNEYRIPGILPLPSGRVLLCCEARADTRSDWGDIDVLVMRREPDGTLKRVFRFGKSHLAADGSMRTYGNPTLIPDGERVHLIFHENYERAFVTTTEDEGETWTEPAEITQAYREADYDWNVCATGPGHGLQMTSGRLIAPIWLANGEVQGKVRKHWPSKAGCVFSDDHGKTWHAGALETGMTDGNETSVAQLSDGKLLFNFRNRNDERFRMLGLSANGESYDTIWQAKALCDPQCFGGMTAFNGGAVFANCATQTNRTNLTVKLTQDAGKSWETVWNVDEMGGYIDIGALNGKLYVFYERYDYTRNATRELVLKIAGNA